MSEHAATHIGAGALPVDNDHVKRVVRKMFNGLVVPLLGAGVNMPGRPDGLRYSGPADSYLPNGSELANYLAREFDYTELAKRTRRREDLLRVSQYLDVMEGSGELYQRLHDVFSASYPPGPVHMFLARVQRLLREAGKGSQVILTTNYDDALERAFDSIEEPYDLLTYVCANPAEHRGRFAHRAPGATKYVPIENPNEYTGLDPRTRPVILKMHGAVVRCDTFEQDNYVITEDHYIDYLAHTDITQLLPTPIPQRLRNSHFLFLGYGMADWNLRVILRRIWGTQGLDYPSWSIQHEPDELETRFWRDRGVTVFDIDVAKYVDRLRVEVLNQRGLPLSQ
jgi:SIR2-like domain